MAGNGSAKKGKKQQPQDEKSKKQQPQDEKTVPEATTATQQLFGKWTGKTPVTLLNEHVQKNIGWQRADYNMRGTAGHGFICVVRMTKVDKKQPTDPVSVVFEPTATETMPLRHATALEARHVAATYALHRLRSAATNMHLMLPPLFRAYWADLEKERKASTEPWRYASDPFATKVARTKEREARAAEREKTQERYRRAKATGHNEDLMRPSVRSRWDDMAEVNMSDAHRRALESVIRTWTSDWGLGDSPPSSSADASASIGGDLVALGFRQLHVDEALQYASTRDQALDWLCVHVPEDDLPDRFMRRAYRAAPVVVAPAHQSDAIGVAAVHAAAKRLARSGFPTSAAELEIVRAIDTAAVSIDMAEAQAAYALHSRLCGGRQQQPAIGLRGSWKEAVADELHALDAIYAGEDRVMIGDHRISVALRTETEEDVRLEFWFPPGLEYPDKGLPAITVASDTLPAYLKLHAARKLDSLVNRDGLPVLFEAVSLADQELHAWIAAPAPLTELTGSLNGVTRQDGDQSSEKSGSVKARSNRTTQKTSTIAGGNAKDVRRLADQFAKLQTDDGYRAMQKERARLPAAQAEQQIIDLVSTNSCVVVAGATGCGKTTQVPQFLLDHGLRTGQHVNIICTQPRRLSAVGVAGRVAAERSTQGAHMVGYAVRGESKQTRDTRLLFCTTGVLLRMLAQAPSLDGVTHVVCDEVHERSVDSDLLLALLRAAVALNGAKLRVVLMSATARSDVFARFFGAATPVVSIPGRTFPVTDVYLDDYLAGEALDAWERRHAREDRAGDVDYVLAARVVAQIHAEAPMDQSVLVFMPGVGEIQTTVAALEKSKDGGGLLVLPLHAGLAPMAQRKVFAAPPKGMRKIVVATNVAETSITIDDIGYVVDAGRARTLVYDAQTRIARLITAFCSQAAAMQRRGRAGRVSKGTCYKLYTRAMEQRLMPLHEEPEIRRAPLEQVCLQVKALGYPDAATLLDRTLDPPDRGSIDSAQRLLVAVGACESPIGELLALGRLMAQLPVDLRLAKMLVIGALFGALDAALPLVALMALDRPLVSAPHELRDAARDARIRSAPPSALSDWIADLSVYTNKTSAAMQFVSAAAMREVKRSVKLLRQSIERTGLVDPSAKQSSNVLVDTMVLKAIVLAGLSPNIARVRVPQQKYHEVIGGSVGVDHQARELAFYAVDPYAHTSGSQQSGASAWMSHDRRTDQRLFIHPQSAMFAEPKYPVPFITYFALSASDKQKNDRVYVRDVTVPGVYALLLLGPPLLVDHDNKVISIGASGALAVRAWPRIAVLVNQLRRLMDELLRRKLDDPKAVALEGHPVVDAVLHLIRTDGK
ncbi:helicase [Coemansia sp. RSA 1933]|nr:helicase [Coemansia sp. RSA 1933]